MRNTFTAAAAIACLLLSSVPALAQVQPTAPAATQVIAGDKLMTTGRYAEAAQQYEAAYAIDPNVAILQRLAEAYRRAGNTSAYNATNQRIAVMNGGNNEPPPPPPPPGYATEPPPTYAPQAPPTYAPQAPPTYAPQAPPSYAPYRPYAPYPYRPYYARRAYVLRPGQALINAGVGMLISGYAASFVTGAITVGWNANANGGQSSWYGAGGSMFIPIAGPFVSLAFRQDIGWAVPVTIIGGGLQLSGLALIITGAIIRANAHPGAPARRADAKPLPFSLTPYSSSQGGGGLMMAAHF
jgi:hypothetical protein